MNASDIERKIEISRLFDYYGSLLSEKQREMFSCYYNEDLSLAEIAELFGITRQGVRDALKKSENHLRDAEEKLKMLERFDRISASVTAALSILEREGASAEAIVLLKSISD